MPKPVWHCDDLTVVDLPGPKGPGVPMWRVQKDPLYGE
jgi:hypothetical protein